MEKGKIYDIQLMEKFIKEICRKAGKLTLAKFGKTGVKKTKVHQLDVVTQADLASNKFLISSIKKRYPKHGIISEETGNFQEDSDYIWVIDPLDGSLNFARKIPIFVTQVALLHKGRPELGAIYYSVTDALYFAKRNGGASLNGRRISCSSKKNLDHSVGAYVSKLNPYTVNLVKKLLKHEKNGLWFRAFASCGFSSAAVATGSVDWYISKDGFVWDYAPTSLILRESGCRVTDLKGNSLTVNSRNILAANPSLHARILKLLQ